MTAGRKSGRAPDGHPAATAARSPTSGTPRFAFNPKIHAAAAAPTTTISAVGTRRHRWWPNPTAAIHVSVIAAAAADGRDPAASSAVMP